MLNVVMTMGGGGGCIINLTRHHSQVKKGLIFQPFTTQCLSRSLHANTGRHTQTDRQTDRHTHRQKYTPRHTRTHTREHTDRHTHTREHTDTHDDTQAGTLIVHKETHTRRHTQPCTHTYIYASTDIYTHTHQPYIFLLQFKPLRSRIDAEKATAPEYFLNLSRGFRLYIYM